MERNEQGEQKHSAEIEFYNDKNGKRIKSSEDDFIMLAWSLKTTIVDGKQKIVEIKDTNSYYENIEYFIDETKDEIKNAVKEINAGRTKLSSDFRIEEAISDIIEGKFNTKQVKELVENYFYVFAHEILVLDFLRVHFNKFKQNSSDQKRFTELLNLSGKVCQDHLFAMPPLKSIACYKNISKIDLDYISKSLLHQEKSSQEKWKALTNNGTQGVDGHNAAKHLVDDYSDYYELVKKMLRHLAFVASCSNLSTLEDSQAGIEEKLKNGGYGQLLDSVDKLLRNCGSHWEADYSEKGIVKLVESRSGTVRIRGKISYNDLIKNLVLIKELSKILLLSIMLMETMLYIRTLDSPDFKFKIVENYKPVQPI